MTTKGSSKILVVDDDPANFKLILDNFQEDSYELMYAPNGREGCKVAEKELPDLIIMDWDMPVMNGIEAILHLRSVTSTADIPIVMATGVMTGSGNLKEALDAGATDFLNKPFDSLELIARVNTAIKLNQSYQLIKKQNEEIRSYMEMEIDYKDRELLLETLHRHENGQFISQIGDKISDIEKRISDGNFQDEITKLKKTINNHLRTENNWENFTIHFKNVHPNFFANLRDLYTDMTPNEQRLCAYIKIGLNNKEIAQLLGVTIGTTKTNLNRLKKKLALDGEDSLREFIVNFTY